MGTDPRLLRDPCARTLERTDFAGLGTRDEGKVRDSYVSGDRRTIVVTDRVSCFDVVVGTMPFKGQVLNQLAAFWFEKTRALAPNHLLSVPDPNVSVVRECKPLPVEFVVRGYLTGHDLDLDPGAPTRRASATTAATRCRTGCASTSRCPRRCSRRPRRRPRASTTSSPRARRSSRAACSAPSSTSAPRRSRHALFAAGQRWAASRGLILVDTKYELGSATDGALVVIDEIHTPDSSRYWYRDSYERALSEGRAPEALDKEYVRRWLGEQGYQGDGPPPELPGRRALRGLAPLHRGVRADHRARLRARHRGSAARIRAQSRDRAS